MSLLMSDIQTFERSVELDATPQQTFDWHASRGAFELLTPPWMRVEVEQPLRCLADGERTVFRVYRGPTFIRWHALHENVRPGHGFVDIQEKGPFAQWRHEHLFEPFSGSVSASPQQRGCLMRDRVHYRLPAGKLGQWVAGSFIRRDLERLFDYRHRVTRDALAAVRSTVG